MWDPTPSGFDPEDIRVEDVPAACWYILTKLVPPAAVLGALLWGFTTLMFLLAP